jgi:hypothetical protein
MWLGRTSNSLRENWLRSVLALPLVAVPLYAKAQATPAKNQPPWKESLAPAAKGTHITLPKNLIQAIRPNPDECNSLPSSDVVKVDAFLVPRRGQKLIAVGGCGSCFCSATGNCAFWVFCSQKGRYEKILDTDMVQQSHGSAFDSGGVLWQFDGESYQQICTWLLTSRRENDHGEWIDVGPYITLNGCETNHDQR